MLKPSIFYAVCLSFCLLLSFGSYASVFQEDCPVPSFAAKLIDVKNDFKAAGDGQADDTKAIQDALDFSGEWSQIYLPPGTYLVSNTLAFGRFRTIRGAGPGQTTIKLKDNCSGYTSSGTAKAVILDEYGSNTTHSVNIMNLTVDVGSGNPGAVALDYQAHNGGSAENVVLKAAAGSGHTGILMTRAWPGNALISRVKIVGFNVGMHVSHTTYSMVFEHIYLENQRSVGFKHDKHPVSIRKLISKNSCPAMSINEGQVILLDSDFSGGSGGNAITGSGRLYMRNCTASGYDAVIAGQKASVDEYCNKTVTYHHSTTPKRALKLGIKETPLVPWDPIDKWVSVEDYVYLTANGDWSDAVQTAIDDGATTIYFPNSPFSGYRFSKPVHVRGNLRYIMGFSSKVYIDKSKAPAEGMPVFIFDNPDPSALCVVEQVLTYGANYDYYHKSAMTVIIKQAFIHGFKNDAGSGDLFLVDVTGENIVFNKNNVWVRNINTESRDANVRNSGAKLWVLGWKTEQQRAVCWNENGALTEVLGGFVYPVQGAVPGAENEPMWVNDNSAITLFHCGSGYPYYVREVRDGNTEQVKQASNPSFYVSNPDGLGDNPVSARTDRELWPQSVIAANPSVHVEYPQTGALRIYIPYEGKHTVTVFGADGRRMIRKNVSGWGRHTLSVGAARSKGIYVVRIDNAHTAAASPIAIIRD